MARFDVYANPDPGERQHTPYLLDVQNDYISGLATRVVIPLRQEAAFGPRARNLNPLVQVGGNSVVLDAAALAAIPATELRHAAGHLRDARPLIQEALDTLLGAY